MVTLPRDCGSRFVRFCATSQSALTPSRWLNTSLVKPQKQAVIVATECVGLVRLAPIKAGANVEPGQQLPRNQRLLIRCVSHPRRHPATVAASSGRMHRAWGGHRREQSLAISWQSVAELEGQVQQAPSCELFHRAGVPAGVSAGSSFGAFSTAKPVHPSKPHGAIAAAGQDASHACA